jgi:hypothetical protein
MLAKLLPGAQVAGEGASCRVACICAVPPHAASHAASLARRLKKQQPGLKVVVALWASDGIERIKPRLLDAGVDEVATQLPEVLASLGIRIASLNSEA